MEAAKVKEPGFRIQEPGEEAAKRRKGDAASKQRSRGSCTA